MTVEQIIEKAIEGEWKHEAVSFDKNGVIWNWATPECGGDYGIADIVLERSFWQALGKSMEWNGKHKWHPYTKGGWYDKQYGKEARRCMICTVDNFRKSYVNPYTNEFVSFGKECPKNTAIYHWHQLIDHIDQSGSIESYFESLQLNK